MREPITGYKGVSDQELIELSKVECEKGGDHSAFTELVKRHQSKLRYSLRQLTGWDEALADDLAQETFIKALKGLSGFRKEAKFSTWLYRIAYNLFISHCRKQSINTEQELSENDHPSVSHKDQTDLHQDLAVAMQSLSIKQRTALHLLLHRECTYQEISDIMGLPMNTIKTHISRGREILQHQLISWKR